MRDRRTAGAEMDVLASDLVSDSKCTTGGAGPIVEALMREIVACAARLAATGEASAIDLQGLPMLPADRDALADRLGQGEVTATVRVAGDSEIRETGYAGIWWIRHLGVDGDLAGEQIEIAEIPDILRAHRDDISFSAERLAEILIPDIPERLDKDAPHV